MKTMKSHKLSIASGLCAMLLAATMLTGCGKKATKHYESYLGIVFVCKDCYDDIVELNS